MNWKFGGLWQQPDFLKFWAGDTISAFGTQISALALPLTAVLVLDATPAQMGLLGVARLVPALLLNLFAGVWVDRLPRRPILIVTNLGLALTTGFIPLFALLGILRIEYLYLSAFLSGCLNVFFFVAYQAYLPALVEREQLTEGNSKLESSNSVAWIVGPGLAGSLIQLLSAPVTIVLDALSYLSSAFLLSLIRVPEALPPVQKSSRKLWAEIDEGLRVVLGHPLLRPIVGCTATGNFAASWTLTVYTLYAVHELSLLPAMLGFIYACGGIGALFGASIAGRVARRFGLGTTLIGSTFLIGLGSLLVPLASGLNFLVVMMLAIGQFLSSLMILIYQINQVSIRQAIVPGHLQGRASANTRFIVIGIGAFGALAGSFAGEVAGLRSALFLGSFISILSCLWLFFSGIRHLREQPTPNEAQPLASS